MYRENSLLVIITTTFHAMLLLSKKTIFIEDGNLGEFYKKNKEYIDFAKEKVKPI